MSHFEENFEEKEEYNDTDIDVEYNNLLKSLLDEADNDFSICQNIPNINFCLSYIQKKAFFKMKTAIKNIIIGPYILVSFHIFNGICVPYFDIEFKKFEYSFSFLTNGVINIRTYHNKNIIPINNFEFIFDYNSDFEYFIDKIVFVFIDQILLCK